MRRVRTGRPTEAGVALVISILVLFVLSVLALALILTTATETEIAVNHRWGDMALYNADAGLELAKNVLAGYTREPGAQRFQTALPPPRPEGAMDSPPAGASEGRDYQYSVEETPGVRLYIGKVLYKPVRAGSSQESNDLNLSELDENNLPTWKRFDATHAGPTLVVSPVRSPSDPPRDPPQQRPDQNYNVFFNKARTKNRLTSRF